MTLTDQYAALREFGYSPKESEFVTKAALHSGYFLARQFNEGRGNPVMRLCQKVVSLGHATVKVYGKRTRLYHLQAKPLYRALGQTDNRHRKEQDTYRLRAKLMGFDYVLLHPEYRYLPTEQDKLDYFCDERGLGLEILPTKMYTGENGDRTRRYFIEKFPIRIDPATGAIAVCYVDAGVFADIAFSTWLGHYAPLITALGRAEIVYVANSEARFPEAARKFAKVFPLPNAPLPADMLAYFAERRDLESGRALGRTQAQLDAFRKLTKRYSDSRYERQYEVWKAAQSTPEEPLNITFSTFAVPFSYSWFGTAGGEK